MQTDERMAKGQGESKHTTQADYDAQKLSQGLPKGRSKAYPDPLFLSKAGSFSLSSLTRLNFLLHLPYSSRDLQESIRSLRSIHCCATALPVALLCGTIKEVLAALASRAHPTLRHSKVPLHVQ